MVKKSAGTLPIRKAKFNPTPVSGQGITKFFDRKQEQVRLQQQLQRQKPTAQNASFSAHAYETAAAASVADSKGTNSASAVPAQAGNISLHVNPEQVPNIRPLAAVPPAVAFPAPAKQPAATVAPLMEHQSQSTLAPQAVSTASGSSSRHDDGAKQSSMAAVGVKLPQLRPADNSLYSMMSQDDDGCCIRWRASPQHQSQMPSPVQAGSGHTSLPDQDINSMKQRLAMAVQKTAGSPAKSAARSQSSDAHDSLMEDLLALPPPQHSRLHKMTSHNKAGLKVLSPSVKSNTGSPLPEAAGHTPVVPASHLNASNKLRASFEIDQEAMSGSPSCAVTGSIPRWKARHRHRGGEHSGAGKKRSAGRKRKALLELLDQVELLVQSRNVRERLDGNEELVQQPEGPQEEALGPMQEEQPPRTLPLPLQSENMPQVSYAAATAAQDQQSLPEACQPQTTEKEMHAPRDTKADCRKQSIQDEMGVSRKTEECGSPDSKAQAQQLNSDCVDSEPGLGSRTWCAAHPNGPPVTPAAHLHSTHVVPDSSQQLLVSHDEDSTHGHREQMQQLASTRGNVVQPDVAMHDSSRSASQFADPDATEGSENQPDANGKSSSQHAVVSGQRSQQAQHGVSAVNAAEPGHGGPSQHHQATDTTVRQTAGNASVDLQLPMQQGSFVQGQGPHSLRPGQLASTTTQDRGPQEVRHRSGLVADALASDIFDELDAQVAQQIEEAEAQAKQVQHAKQAQHSGGSSEAAPAQEFVQAQPSGRGKQAKQAQHAQVVEPASAAAAVSQTAAVSQQNVTSNALLCGSGAADGQMHKTLGATQADAIDVTSDAMETTSDKADDMKLDSKFQREEQQQQRQQQQQQQRPQQQQQQQQQHLANAPSAVQTDNVAPQPQHSGTQRAGFDFDPFLDSCELDAELAQLLDSAATFRPAGVPDTSRAGPRPMPTELKLNVANSKPSNANASTARHRPKSAGSRPHSAGSGPAMLGTRPNSAGSRPNSAGPRPNSAGSRQNSAEAKPNAGGARLNAPGSRPALAPLAGDNSLTADARSAGCCRDGVMVAPEPAGPCDDETPADLAKLVGDRTNIHFQVKEVHSSDHEKTVVLEGSYSQDDVVLHLHDGWADTPVLPGHSLNLIAEKTRDADGRLHAVCNFEAGMVILHPDLLLSGTRVSSSFRCKRQAVLEERFAGSSSDKAVEGTILHEVFQAALTHRITNRARLEEVARQVVTNSTDKLLEVGLDERMVMTRVYPAIPSMLSWVQRFLRPQPAQNARVEVGLGGGVQGGSTIPMCVRQVVDIEENVWAPKYGLKGMIDASLSAAYQQHQQRAFMQSASHPQVEAAEDVMIPLEFKTGKPHISHRAQASLYLLLMQERYGQIIESGLLWYLGSASPQQVRLVPAEIQALIMHRNALAGHLLPGQALPAVIRDDWACSKCFQKAACALSHKALEQGCQESSGLGDAFTELTGHVSEAASSFFQHWLHLIELEEAPGLSKRAEIWNIAVTALPVPRVAASHYNGSGGTREQSGRCISNLVLDTNSQQQLPQPPTDNQQGQVLRHKWIYTFGRASQAADVCVTSQAGFRPMNECGFAEGDMMVLSIEGEQACVCRPSLVSLSASSVTVAVDKPLRGSMMKADVVWRLDKDEISSTFTKMRCNLLDMMSPVQEHVQLARRLIADLEAPRPPQPPTVAPTKAAKTNSLPSLNEDQNAAVSRVLNTPDYTLILGMPGTGKTSTIVHAIKGLVAQGKSVLLSSYTNSAVDTVLAKLIQEGVQFLRLGRKEAVHPLVQGWVLGGPQHSDTSVQGLRQLSQSAQVVACTALGLNHPILKGRVFDMCILDEAGQITLPVALGPVLRSRAFTLVGDHYQLPPLVTSRAAEEGGLGVSLFKRLCEAHPQAVVALREQYRMAADIMLLANTLVYDGQLRCGAQAVADASLDLQVAPSQLSQPAWLLKALQPQQCAVFLDTDALPAPEVQAGDALSNPQEANIVKQLVTALHVGGVALQNIGVISPYRSQVMLLQRMSKTMNWPELEVLTIDKSQGRDKDVVLLSLVRSNQACNAGKLLQDWRRLNVAITRAKKKLVLVGSYRTLNSIPHLADLLKLMSSKQWCYSLPPMQSA